MDFPQVKSAHIVPRSYLMNFAVDGQLQLNVDGRRLPHPVSIDDAAVRNTFYRRKRPDGTTIDDVEWSLSQMESALAPIIQDLKGNWPPTVESVKAPLAEFFAFQFVRGPRFKKWREDKLKGWMEDLRRNPEPIRLPSGLLVAVTQRRINEIEDQVLSETEWLTRMMVISGSLLAIFLGMTWHLVEFEEPCLAISDHPVVSWPKAGGPRTPQPNLEDLGALNFLEVRAPISPTLALLMTWSPPPDGQELVVGTRELAASINAFTIANADRQWMSTPGIEVPIADGLLDPVSPALVPDYGPGQADDSPVRELVGESVQKRLGATLPEVVDEDRRLTIEAVVAQEVRSLTGDESPRLK
jgi:hypothetical protein